MCAIQTYEILKSDLSAVTSSDELYAFLNLANRVSAEIQINTYLAQQNGLIASIPQTFIIKAIAFGGASVTKTVEINLIVCSGETLGLAYSSP